MEVPHIQLIHGRSETELKKLASNSVDLIVTSPPYNIGKDYETVVPLDEYLQAQMEVLSECFRVLKPTGSLCWQVGFTKDRGEIVPLDALYYPLIKELGFRLKNRIVWTFGHGMHAQKRFSGRHETIMWFAKDIDAVYFDVEGVRVPQKYPGKKHYRGPKKGKYSGHPNGKNPGDVWDIPNVKSHHVEKTTHQCQFPIALVQRIIRGLCPSDGVVLDPYSGVGTTSCAAVIEGRRSIGIELDATYDRIARERVALAQEGSLKFRPIEKPVQVPDPRDPNVTRRDIS